MPVAGPEFKLDDRCQGLQVYLVGGAVRDALLGLPVADRDWVVVGSSPVQMLDRGFVAVGQDFPVFLHPDTHEEYALARTERKSGPGYKGFQFHAGPDVSLADDLRRRDLTINAMACDSQGTLHDPWGGYMDLQARTLRHVSEAFREDPVRLLRLGRFAARFEGFDVAPATLELCCDMVQSGEVDHLVPERVWQEFARGLMAPFPARMIEVLQACHAWPRLAPGLDLTRADCLRRTALAGLNLAQRVALLLEESEASARVLRHWRAPREIEDLARLFQGLVAALLSTARVEPVHRPEAEVRLLESLDAWRRPQRAVDLLTLAHRRSEEINLSHWLLALQQARGIDAGAVAAQCAQQSEIPSAIRAARIAALGRLSLAASGV